jgi:hypothetical protein
MTCTTCGRPADAGYVNPAAGERCVDAVHTPVTKTTPELVAGDVVLVHGMRCLIDTEPLPSRCHPGSSTFYVRALVLNPDEVRAARVVPMSWLYDERADDTEPRWTIQGNELARWSVIEGSVA